MSAISHRLIREILTSGDRIAYTEVRGIQICFLLMVTTGFAPEVASAQEPVSVSESIVVTGRRESATAASFETRHSLGTDEIDVLAAQSLDVIVAELPSAYVPVNSRGEAVVFLRNAGERQVALFYDGALLNIPWDNRLDLSLVPSGLIGSVRSASGPLPPHYGVNALGAVSLSPRETLHLSGLLGDGSLRTAEATVPLTDGVRIGGSVLYETGVPLAGGANLPFHQPSDEIRTNTDRELASLFGRGSRQFGDHQLSLTLFHLWGEKGVPPESDRLTGARFWRYPQIAHTMGILSAKSGFGPETELSSTVWFQAFGQSINNYRDDRYETITLRQVDRDRTWGIRELVRRRTGKLTLVGSFNYLQSTHQQRDITYVGGDPPAALPPQLVYSQRNWSVGGEAEYALRSDLAVELALGFDKVDYVRTGDKPSISDMEGWTGRAGVIVEAGHGWRLRGAIGRKMRAPTMRELFGQALNRFLINPDLKPERIISAELGFEWRGPGGWFTAVPFVQDLKDTIDQRNVGSLRQRINLAGSSVVGVEFAGAWKATPKLTVSGSATLTKARRKTRVRGEEENLAEKPSVLAQMRANYRHPSGWNTSLHLEHVGKAYSADPAGELVRLEKSVAVGWRGGYAIKLVNRRAELFIALDNATDTFVEPQLGLPAPGRSARIGLRISD